MHFRDKTEVMILWFSDGEVVKTQASRHFPLFHEASELHAVKNESIVCSCSCLSPKHSLLLVVRDRIKGKLVFGLKQNHVIFYCKEVSMAQTTPLLCVFIQQNEYQILP